MSKPDKFTTVRRRALVPKEECPLAMAAEILGDRWTLLILREAFYGVQRYDDMLKDLGAPRSMLTDRLSKLVQKGIMTRNPYQEPGDRVRYGYVLSQSGKALATTLVAMTEWGEEYILQKAAPVHVVDKDTGTDISVRFVDKDCQPIAQSKAILAKRGA